MCPNMILRFGCWGVEVRETGVGNFGFWMGARGLGGSGGAGERLAEGEGKGKKDCYEEW